MKTLSRILRAARAWPGPNVLGTVVDVRGAAYRRPGARMLIGASGERVGMISGGCLEKEVVRHALAWTAAGPIVVEFDTRADELRPAGAFGTGCDGIVHVLLERQGALNGVDVIAEIEQVWETRQPRVVATVYDGPVERVGERIVWRPGKPAPGTIDFDLREALAWSRPRSVKAGGVTMLVEPVRPPLDLMIVGAGDDAQSLAAIAATQGWMVRVVDKWPALVTRERFPEARQLTVATPGQLAKSATVAADTIAVLMTHNLSDDASHLVELLGRTQRVVLLGPRSRTRRVLALVAERGELPSTAALDSLQTPAGLNLGGDAPEEVAASIVAGIIAWRNGRDGAFLSDCDGPIHAEHQRLAAP